MWESNSIDSSIWPKLILILTLSLFILEYEPWQYIMLLTLPLSKALLNQLYLPSDLPRLVLFQIRTLIEEYLFIYTEFGYVVHFRLDPPPWNWKDLNSKARLNCFPHFNTPDTGRFNHNDTILQLITSCRPKTVLYTQPPNLSKHPKNDPEQIM